MKAAALATVGLAIILAAPGYAEGSATSALGSGPVRAASQPPPSPPPAGAEVSARQATPSVAQSPGSSPAGGGSPAAPTAPTAPTTGPAVAPTTGPAVAPTPVAKPTVPPEQTEQPGGGSGAAVSAEGVALFANLVWMQRQRGAVFMSEGVRAEYQGTTITADRCDYDTDQRIALFYPYVVVEREGERLVAEKCLFRLEDKTWTLWNATAELSPRYFRGITEDFVYIHAERIDGDDDHADLHDLYFTTCPKARVQRNTDTGDLTVSGSPDYRLQARSGRIDERGDYFQMGSTVLYLGRVPVFWLPGFGVRREVLSKLETLPEIGTNTYEGYYFRWAYRYSGSNYLRVGFTQKQGNTYGADWTYQGGTVLRRFNVVANYRTYSKSFTGSADLQALILNGDLSGSYNLSQVSALATGSSTQENRRFTYSNRGRLGTLSLTAQQNITATDQRRSSTTAGATYQYNFSKTVALDANLQYTANDVPPVGGDPTTLVSDQSLLSSLRLSAKTAKADYQLRYEKQTQLSSAASAGTNYATQNRTPELTAQTDLRRLGVRASTWSMTAQAQVGWVTEPLHDAKGMRYAIDLATQRQPLTFGGTSVNIGGTFRQRWYAGRTARYSLGGTAAVRSKLSGTLASSLTYGYQTAAGYTPFQFDYESRFHTVAASFDWTQRGRVHQQRGSLATGFDFRFHRWSDLRANYNWSARPGNSLATTLSYGLEGGGLGPLYIRYAKRHRGYYDWQMSGGYDFRTSKVQPIRSMLDWEMEKDHWRIRWQTGYNPLSHQFTENSVQLIRYTHCFTYGLTYNSVRREWQAQLQVRGLKSLLAQGFGIGGQGEFISPYTGGGDTTF